MVFPAVLLGVALCFGVVTVDSNSICHDGAEQWRWLSLPGSRLVLNPSLITERSTPLCSALALHAGYYAGAHPLRMQHLAMLRVLNTDETDSGERREWRHTLAPDKQWQEESGWRFQGVTAGHDDEHALLTVTEGGDPWGSASYRITPPFHARGGFVRVHVPTAGHAWALKIGHETLATDLYLFHDTSATGEFVCDLGALDGWRHLDTFDLKFFVVGKNASATLASVEIVLNTDDPDRGLVTEARSVWSPAALSFNAVWESCNAQATGLDFLYDENTLIRLFEVTSETAVPLTVCLQGRRHGSPVPTTTDHPWPGFSTADFTCAFRLMRIDQDSERDITPDFFEEDAFQWTMNVSVPEEGARFALIAAFTPGRDATKQAREIARNVGDIERRLEAHKATWDRLLSLAPAPSRFGLEHVDSRGVTAAEHRRAYYGAWTFVLQNTLPPMPENDYPHAQTPTGKPSLWAEGSSRARASAAWESFFAQQWLALVDVDTAWDAFEGIMMQVDDDGWLDGEVLPSRKAETAWKLYTQSGDAKRLARVYPPIARYLRWREHNPRWIYRDHDNPAQRDSNFVDSLLLDLEYAVRIAEALDSPPHEWHEMTGRMRRDYVKWFFPEDGGHPKQYFYIDTNERHPGHATWVCSGLYLEGLPEHADAALLRLFRSMYNPDHDLGGLDFCKHPIASMIVHGLVRRGLLDEARGYAGAVLRDIIRATRFSENYSFNPLRSWGVEDSMFGAATVIEFTLLLDELDNATE